MGIEGLFLFYLKHVGIGVIGFIPGKSFRNVKGKGLIAVRFKGKYPSLFSKICCSDEPFKGGCILKGSV